MLYSIAVTFDVLKRRCHLLILSIHRYFGPTWL